MAAAVLCPDETSGKRVAWNRNDGPCRKCGGVVVRRPTKRYPTGVRHCPACDRSRDRRNSPRTPEQRQAECAKVAAKRGRSYTPGVKPWKARKTHYRPFRTSPDDFPEPLWRTVEQANARQAWRWWLAHAPVWWLDARQGELYRDRPWRRPSLTMAERYRLRYALDPEFNLAERLRLWTRKLERGAVGEQIRLALKGGAPAKRLAAFLGYSMAELRRHLERQFTSGMDWQRFCAADIHIDHRRPLASFDLSDPDQLRAAWRLDNLQPLWAADNLAKGARTEGRP
jgi:hypothetical protein